MGPPPGGHAPGRSAPARRGPGALTHPDDEAGDSLNADNGARRRHWLLIAALLAPAIVIPLWVPLYDRKDPELFGFPFFYWFQIGFIGVAVALTGAALVVASRVTRLDRVAHGLPPEPPETQ